MWGTHWQSKAHRNWYVFCLTCLSVYIAYVCYFGHSTAFTSTGATVLSVGVFAALSALLYWLLPKLCRAAAMLGDGGERRRRPFSWGFFAVTFLLAAVVLLISYLPVIPGGGGVDTFGQWSFVINGNYVDWHPVFHTLMLLPFQRLFGCYWPAMAAQMLAFAAAFAYLLTTLHTWRVPAWPLIVIEALTMSSSIVLDGMMYFYKDNAMTIGVVLLSAWAVNCFFSRGEWLCKPLNTIAMGLMLACTTLFRHNAFAFTLPYLAMMLVGYAKQWKRLVMVGCVMALLMTGVRGPLNTKLNVFHPDNTLTESTGVPMTMMGNAYMLEREKLGDEVIAFLEDFAPREAWEECYELDMYNSIKWNGGAPDNIDSFSQVFRMLFQTIRQAPASAFQAFNGVTDLVWGVDGRAEARDSIPAFAIHDSHMKKAYETVRQSDAAGVCRLIRAKIAQASQFPVLSYLTENIGVHLMALLLSALVALWRKGIGVLALAFPTLVYALATMLLLSGDDARIFQFIMVTSLPLALAMLYNPPKEKCEEK